MPYYLVNFDLRGATPTPIDASSVESVLAGKSYDEEVIFVGDDEGPAFEAAMVNYTQSFGDALSEFPNYGEGAGYDGAGEPLPSGVGALSAMTAESVTYQRTPKYDEWDLEALKVNGEWDRNKINYLRAQYRIAEKDNVWTRVFDFVRSCPGLTTKDYCCTGWHVHVRHNMERLEKAGA